MAEIEISEADIVAVGDALDGLPLPEGQKALLSAIVALAAETMATRSKPIAIVDGADTTTTFHDQFALSFTPGALEGLEASAGGPTKVVIGRAFKIGRDVDG
jgi:hypothetical protein